MTIMEGMVFDTTGFRRWIKRASVGDTCLYHAGNLSSDRNADPVLNDLADTVMLLSETGAVRTTQYRQYLYITDVWAYLAIRASGGYTPREIIAGTLTSRDWRALRAVRDRAADISATRAIRDVLSASWSSSDAAAREILDSLAARKLVEEAPGKGWQLTAAGLRALT